MPGFAFPSAAMFILLVLGPVGNVVAQTNDDALTLYTQAMAQIKLTQEYKDYMLWAEEEIPFQSGEILYGSEVFFNCPKCPSNQSSKTGVKTTLHSLRSSERKKDYKAIAFFTEIQEDCFSIILKTTFNNDPAYDGGVFVGKQAYFQFTIQDSKLVICSKMTLRNN